MTSRHRVTGFAVLFLLLASIPLTARDFETLVDFTRNAGNPVSGLVRGSDGRLYGTTLTGGAHGLGSVYRLSLRGPHFRFATLHEFDGEDGASPRASLIQATDGFFYGTTSGGGAFGVGTIFRMDLRGTVTLLHSFSPSPGPNLPSAGLIQASDGNLYGTTFRGGPADLGTVFRVDAAGVVTIVHAFDNVTGAWPAASLIEADDGNLYGTTSAGGATSAGTIFRMSLTGIVTVLHSFDNVPFASDRSALIQADGFFYGTTREGGSGGGMVYRMDRRGDVTVLHSFDIATTGAAPSAPLFVGSDGWLYGTASLGGARGLGTIYRMDRSGRVSVLHAFDGFTGVSPFAPLIEPVAGVFYGTTLHGGVSSEGHGTIFRMNASGKVRAVHAFNDGTGYAPHAGLIQTRTGFFLGTTASGGTTSSGGSVFAVNRAGRFEVLHYFDGIAAGCPRSDLLETADGSFYGTAGCGGKFGEGVLYRLDRHGRASVLFSFQLQTTGSPAAALIQARDGLLYGTALGGPARGGTIFTIDREGRVTVVQAFDETSSGPRNPRAALLQAKDGLLYGTTTEGGAFGFGTVFRLNPAGGITVLHDFDFRSTGANPSAPLIQGGDGFLYGTAQFGGPSDNGTVFRIDGSGTFSTLYTFDGWSAANPVAGLIQGRDGFLYGTTPDGGNAGDGTLFRLDAAGRAMILHAFSGASGAEPRASLVQGRGGDLYGTTEGGGKYGGGVVFRFPLPSKLHSDKPNK